MPKLLYKDYAYCLDCKGIINMRDGSLAKHVEHRRRSLSRMMMRKFRFGVLHEV